MSPITRCMANPLVPRYRHCQMAGLGALASCALLLAVSAAGSTAASTWSETPSWTRPHPEKVRAEVTRALEELDVPDIQRPVLATNWSELPESASAHAVLDQVATTIAAVDDRAAALVEFCRSGSTSTPLVLPEVAWLQDSELPAFFTNNLRLLVARRFVQDGLYDEAIDLVADLSPVDVVDPAMLLFCQAVCHHQLVEAKAATTAAELLLERAEEIPVRYQHLARLIAEDIRAVEDDSLDHIARRMNDIRRRLEHGRAGNRVVEIEDGVIASLDKLIEELEEQRRQQQQQQQQQQAGGQSPIQPMEDSRLPTGQQGPGHVDPRNLGDSSGWGQLDDKDREEALQEVGREFPSHYRDVIEQYFRKIATEGEAE